MYFVELIQTWDLVWLYFSYDSFTKKNFGNEPYIVITKFIYIFITYMHNQFIYNDV